MRKFAELTYANPSDRWLKRTVIQKLEDLSGRNKLVPLYDRWQGRIATDPAMTFTSMLEVIGVRLDIVSGALPVTLDPATPLVVVANHPYGILDGTAALSICERLGRPFRVLINRDLMKVPEIRAYSLPIDFTPDRRAQETNIATRREALRLLKLGTVIVVFPAGGVATAPAPFGRAAELPWKTFTSRMIQDARASVLPLYFEGQCRPLFHLVSRYSPTLRLSMIISEFRRTMGDALKVHVGEVIAFENFAHPKDRAALIRELYDRVHALSGRPAPSQDGLPKWLAPELAEKTG